MGHGQPDRFLGQGTKGRFSAQVISTYLTSRYIQSMIRLLCETRHKRRPRRFSGGKLKPTKIACALAVPMLLLAGVGSGQLAGAADSSSAAGSTLSTANAQPAFYASSKDSAAQAAPTIVSQGTTLTADEAQTLLDASVKDRTAEVLGTQSLPAPALEHGKSSNKFKAKQNGDKPILAARKERLKGFGFRYTSASTTVQVVEVSGTDAEATVKFDELATMFMASDTTGPSNVPEQSRVHQTANFVNTGSGWVIDDWAPSDGQGGLPMAVVDHTLPAEALSTEVKMPPRQAAPGQTGAVPGLPGDYKPKPGTSSAAASTTAKAVGVVAPGGSSPQIVRASTNNTGGDYTATLASTGYDYNAMVYYALGHYLYYNQNYKAYGNDCTNFVSQSLGAGGWGLVDTSGMYTDDTQWYYYPWVATRSWTSTPDFFNFATWGSGRTYELAYLNSMGPADVEIADWEGDGLKDHSMIVTSWAAGGGPGGYNDIRVTYHTNDTANKSIWSLYSSYPSGIWYALRT